MSEQMFSRAILQRKQCPEGGWMSGWMEGWVIQYRNAKLSLRWFYKQCLFDCFQHLISGYPDAPSTDPIPQLSFPKFKIFIPHCVEFFFYHFCQVSCMSELMQLNAKTNVSDWCFHCRFDIYDNWLLIYVSFQKFTASSLLNLRNNVFLCHIWY